MRRRFVGIFSRPQTAAALLGAVLAAVGCNPPPPTGVPVPSTASGGTSAAATPAATNAVAVVAPAPAAASAGEAPKPAAPKDEAAKPAPEAAKPASPARPEAPAKPEGPNLEGPKPEAPAADPKPAAPKPEAPAAEAAKPEAPKPDAPKPEGPTLEGPKEKPEGKGEAAAKEMPAKEAAPTVAAEPAGKKHEPVLLAMADSSKLKLSAVEPKDLVAREYWVDVGAGDWPMWAGSPTRNNVNPSTKIPTEWNVDEGTNIKWVSQVGSQTYGNPVVANGQVYVGTNNGAGYIKRYPNKVDLGCLLCFRESDGKFLWQHSNEKLATGRVHDWPLQGVCAAPMIEGKRGWYVSNRGELVCFDVEGFHDDENDGPYKDEKETGKEECDVVWKLDMMKDLGTSQHNMCSCSVTSAGDFLFVNTSNGVDESHLNIPAPNAPSFLAVDKNTGAILWKDSSPGNNIVHGQWGSPAYGVLGGVPQVVFGGGDGWLYSFDPRGEEGKAKLLWKFDLNRKDAKWVLGGRGTRNEPIGTPVLYNNLVYVAIGQDPEHGEGPGCLWCIDPTKRGDVSTELVFNSKDDFKTVVPHKRIQACEPEHGDVARPNPNSAAVWRFESFDRNGDGKTEFEETMHRSCGTVAIKNDLLFVADFSGLFHCIDAKTGKPHWVYDMFAASWGSPLIAGDHVYMGDEDGDIAVFKLSADPEAATPIAEQNMGNSVYTTPVVANDTLFITNKSHVFAIQAGAKFTGKISKTLDQGAD